MTLFNAAGRALTPMEMLAAQITGFGPPSMRGATSLFPKSADVFTRGLMGQPVAASAPASAAGLYSGGGAPFSLARSAVPAAGAASIPGAAGVGGAVAGAAEGAGSLGLLARLGAVPAGLGAAGMGTVASRLGLGGLAGSVGSGVIDKAYPGSNSLGEQTLQGGALGAGLGAAVGSIVPVLGTGVGALVGGGLGAAAGAVTSLLGKGKKKGPESLDAVLGRVIDAGAIDPSVAAQIAQKYQGMVALDDSDKGKELARQAAMQLLQAEVMNPTQSAMGAAPQQWTPEQMLAMQSQSAQFLAPFAQQAMSSAGQARDMTSQLTKGMDPSMAAMFNTGAEQQYSAATRLAGAYATQALLSPQTAAMEQQQNYQQQIASQLAQQAISKMLSGGYGAGGGQDLTSLLGQLGAGAGAGS